MLSILGFILAISLLVFIHEFGHYYVAKMFGVKIEEFSIGFGKELFSKIDKAGVKWKICALPFGGYVKMYGFDHITPQNGLIPNEAFLSKSLYAQFLIVAAGPVANYLLAILIFTTIYFFHGRVEIPAIIGAVVENSPATISGIQKNDQVIMVNNNTIKGFADLQRNILMNGTKIVNFLIERDGKIINIQIIPQEISQKSNSKKTPYIGIIAKNEPIFINMNILQSIYQGYLDVVDISKLILQTFGQILIGNKSLDEIGGTITIAKESGNSLAQGPISFVLFLAMLSVNLGLLNFLPIPVLDGGHLAFIIYQVIFGKPVNQSIKNIIITLGVGLLVFFIVISIANDIKGIVF